MRQLIPILLIGLVIASGCSKSPEEERQQKIKEALKQITKGIDCYATDALIALNAKEAIPELTKLLQHTNPDVRWQAVWALGYLDDKESIPQISGLLRDTDPGVRRTAVYALGHLNAKKAIPDIIKLLQDKDPGVREAARVELKALGVSGD